MTTKQYIGARYVPIFGRIGEESITWDNTKAYEPLTIVLHEGNSYTSRQNVPIGVDIENQEYWALTGNYNAQVEQYKNEVEAFDSRIKAVYEMESIFNDVSEIVRGTYGNTTYMYSMIPAGNQIKAAYHPSKNVTEYAIENNTSLSCNAGFSGRGAVISDGVIVVNNTSIYPYNEYIAFDNNGNVTSFPYNTNPTDIIHAGYTNAALAYYKLVENGSVKNLEDLNLPEDNLKLNPRSGIFVDSSNNIYFIATNGRLSGELGLTPEQFGSLMVSLGAINGWNLDGGGSTCLVRHGVKVNRGYDNFGLYDREIDISFYVPKKEVDSENETLELISKLNAISSNDAAKVAIANTARYCDNVNNMKADDMVFPGVYYSATAINMPNNSNAGFLIVFARPSAHGSNRMLQIWQPLETDGYYKREFKSNNWGEWGFKASIFPYNNFIIPQESDLNSYTVPGKYNVESTTVARNIINIPSVEGGNLLVIGASQSNFVYQIYIGITSNTMFIRRVNVASGTAEPWFSINAFEEKKITATAGATGNINLSDIVANQYELVSCFVDGYISIPFINNGTYFTKIFNYSTFEPVTTRPEVEVIVKLARKNRT